jgi:hypothetical protein
MAGSSETGTIPAKMFEIILQENLKDHFGIKPQEVKNGTHQNTPYSITSDPNNMPFINSMSTLERFPSLTSD